MWCFSVETCAILLLGGSWRFAFHRQRLPWTPRRREPGELAESTICEHFLGGIIIMETYGLEKLGIVNPTVVYRNLTPAQLTEHALRRAAGPPHRSHR